MIVSDKDVTLYKRNSNGTPIGWRIYYNRDTFFLEHGVVGGTLIKESFKSDRKPVAEIKSRINRKRKEGYVELSEVYDNAPKILSDNEIVRYLNTYLPKVNTNIDNSDKPMKAVTFEYDKYNDRYGQFKINGIRAHCSYVKEGEGFFAYDSLKLTTQEGTELKVPTLISYLKESIPNSIFDKMKYENYILDGEIYLPGHPINEINSACKNLNNPLNKYLQYWIYDLAVPDIQQNTRFDMLKPFESKFGFVKTEDVDVIKDFHLNNKNRLVYIPHFEVRDDKDSVRLRDAFIEAGFEGLISRAIYSPYQFGCRNQAMVKFKKIYDGLFEILDIIPEGKRRANLPKVICRNDINSETFECTIVGKFDYQEQVLKDRGLYIGKKLFVEYRERSGINQLPFHAKGIKIIL